MNAISIQETKNLLRNSGFIVKDVSGSNSFGYDFAIFKSEEVIEPVRYTRPVGEPLVTSETVYDTDAINKIGAKGAFRVYFNRESVEALLAKV